MYHKTFSAQYSEVIVRDMNFKFGREALRYMYLGHAKYDGHMTTTNISDQGSVLSLLPKIFISYL